MCHYDTGKSAPLGTTLRGSTSSTVDCWPYAFGRPSSLLLGSQDPDKLIPVRQSAGCRRIRMVLSKPATVVTPCNGSLLESCNAVAMRAQGIQVVCYCLAVNARCLILEGILFGVD